MLSSIGKCTFLFIDKNKRIHPKKMVQRLITTQKSKIKYKECVYLLSSKSKSDSKNIIPIEN